MRSGALGCLVVAIAWGLCASVARAGEPDSGGLVVEVEPLLNTGIAGAPYPVRVRVRTTDRPLRGWVVARELLPPWGPSVRRRVEMEPRSQKELWLLLRPALQPIRPSTAVEITLLRDEANAQGNLPVRASGAADESPAEDHPGEEDPEAPPRLGTQVMTPAGRVTLRFQMLEPARERVLLIGRRAVSVPRGRSGMAPDSSDLPRRAVWSLEPDRVPPLAKALEGFNTIVLTADSIAGMDPASLQAIVEWCRQGGRLVVGGGRNSDALGASMLGGALPLEVTGSRLVPGQESVQLLTGLPAGEGLRAASELLAIQGELRADARVIVAGASGAPLVTARAHGAGEIVLIALQLDSGPLARRRAALNLWSRLLPIQDTAADLSDDEWSLLTLNEGMESRVFEALLDSNPRRPVGVALLLLVMILYVLALGPGDYWLVVRWARRPLLTWVTFPLLVAAFAALAWLGGRSGATQLARATAVCFVEADSTGAAVRGVGWMNLASPANRKFLVGIDRGISSVTPCLAELQKDSEFLNDDWLEVRRRDTEVCEVPVHIGTSRTLRFDWVEREGAGEMLCRMELIREGMEVVGVRAWPAKEELEPLLIRARLGGRVWQREASSEPPRDTASSPELVIRFDSGSHLVESSAEVVPDLDWSQRELNPHLALLPRLGRMSLGMVADMPLSLSPGLRDLAHGNFDDQVVVAVFLEGLPVAIVADGTELSTQGLTCVRRVLRR